MPEQSLRYQVDVEDVVTDYGRTLVERLERPLREVSAGIADSFSGLVLEALKGGVHRIDSEIDGFVGVKVSDAIAERTPELIDLVTTRAADEARDVAGNAISSAQREAKVAADRLIAQVNAIEQRVRDSLNELLTRVETEFDSHRRAQAESTSQIDALRLRIAELEASVVELRKPRGLAALYARWFGVKRQEPVTTTEQASASGVSN